MNPGFALSLDSEPGARTGRERRVATPWGRMQVDGPV